MLLYPLSAVKRTCRLRCELMSQSGHRKGASGRLSSADQSLRGGLYFCPRLRQVSSEKPIAHSPASGSVTSRAPLRLRQVSAEKPMGHSRLTRFGSITRVAPLSVALSRLRQVSSEKPLAHSPGGV